MPHTQLFSVISRSLAECAAKGAALQLRRTSALSRRQMLRLSAAAAGALALGPVSAEGSSPRIAIIGGGAAGLTAAFRLSQHGLDPAVYEASNRWGGRMFTLRNFYGGMFCELGGELVDTNHDDLRTLAGELGLALQPLGEHDLGEDLYFFGGKIRTMRDMFDPATGRGAFVPIATRLAEDSGKLVDGSGNWTGHARELDQISLAEYLHGFRSQAQGWAIELLDIAYEGEFGLETREQSSLNLVDLITTKPDENFRIFGASDEAFRVQGGSSSLISALVEAVRPKCKMELGTELVGMARSGNEIILELQAHGPSRYENFDVVLLTLPFTRLRTVHGLDVLGLRQEKLSAIRSLGYGNNAKVICGTKSRAWRSSEANLPAASRGTFYSDLPLQTVWETSRAQESPGGILTNFLAGTAARADQDGAVNRLVTGLAAISPKIAESIDREAAVSFFWERYRHTLGSYAGAKVGQYTTLLEVAATPELDGRLQFAGEHTSAEFLGFMNGAIQSGNRAASAIHAMTAPRKSAG